MAEDQNYFVQGDPALSSGDEDKLGFCEVAKRIATSLVDRASEDGLFIGIEGTWGSGKSSLLFLIGDELGKLPKDQQPTVIDFRPWLIGDRDALITSLFGELSKQLAQVASNAGDAVDDTPFGSKYIAEGRLSSPDGRNPRLRVIWFVEAGETIPRLVTAYAVAGVVK